MYFWDKILNKYEYILHNNLHLVIIQLIHYNISMKIELLFSGEVRKQSGILHGLDPFSRNKHLLSGTLVFLYVANLYFLHIFSVFFLYFHLNCYIF